MNQTPTISEVRSELEKLRTLKTDVSYDVNPKTGVELYDVNKSFDEQIIRGVMDAVIGNEDIRTLAVLLFGLRNHSICITGVSGSAKTTIYRGIINLLFGDEALDDKSQDIIIYSGGSDKAFLNDDVVTRLQDCTHMGIEEMQNVFRGSTGSDSVMEDIIKTMTTGDTFFYTRTTGGGSGVEQMAIPPMNILTTRANENQRLNEKRGYGEEIERRFISLYTTSDRAMNRKVHIRKALNEAIPDEVGVISTVKKRSEIRNHLKSVRDMDFDNIRGRRVGLNILDLDTMDPPARVKNIVAPFVEHIIPKEFTISNTLINYWHSAIKAVTAFYYKDRIIVTKNKKRYLLSTPSDVYMAWTLFGESLINQCFSIKDIGRKVLSALPVRSSNPSSFALDDTPPVSIDFIRDALLKEGMNRSVSQIEQILGTLLMAGYAKSDKQSNGKLMYYKTRDYDSEFEVGVDWPTVIDNVRDFVYDLYPEVADEYVARFCDNPICVHPLKGTVVDLNTLTLREVAAIRRSEKAERSQSVSDFMDSAHAENLFG